MSSKTILITGCSKASLGDALAQEAARRGLHVIATARTLDKIKHLEGLGIQIEELDTTSTQSIEALRVKISHLDILFNNAGVNYICTIADTSMDEFRRMFDVNVFGSIEVTKAFMPLVILSQGIIINHTSQSPYAVPTLSGGYAASKAALASFTDTLRIEMKPFGVRVVELVTGGAMSNITANMKPPFIAKGSIYEPIAENLIAATNPETVRKSVMAADVYAKKVMDDILRNRGPPLWTWRGTGGTALWVAWIIKCLWKGSLDWVIARTCGLHLLKARLREAETKKVL